ncbi:MAG: hypothetical protein E7672_00205 [Ruminococcaceae bacterium]|nr:hypothetical protein [Oscillospiraceae bacterium]
MKKILSMILVLVMLATLFASCSNDQNESESKNNESINDQKESDTTPEDTESETEADTEESETEIEEPVVLEPPYKRVVLIGVDGAGAFFQKTDTPNLDRIFENGAVTYEAITSTPSISAQCWGSLIHGVTADVHRLTNSIAEKHPYGISSRIPSIFSVVRENDPEAVLASICNWNPINIGIVEDDIGIHKDTGNDSKVTYKVCKYLQKNDPKLLFVHFDSVDGAGHADGYGSKKHLQQITTIDGYIGTIYGVLDSLDMLEDTLFIVTTDHGGTPEGSHGGDTDAEMKIMYAAIGHNVQKGSTIGEMSIRDNAAIVMYALGYDVADEWTSRIPGGLFEGVEEQERPIYTPPGVVLPERDYESQPTPAAGSGEHITDFFSEENIAAYLTLDGDASDSMGKVATEPNGKLYYVEGYYGQGTAFDDGYITLKDYKPGSKDFSIAFWLKTSGLKGEQALFSNKDISVGKNAGFTLSLKPGALKFNTGNTISATNFEYTMPANYKEGWVHVVLSVNRTFGSISVAYDFGDFQKSTLNSAMKFMSFNALDLLNIGQDGTGTYENKLSAAIDDIIIFNTALKAQDLARLSDYYNIEE